MNIKDIVNTTPTDFVIDHEYFENEPAGQWAHECVPEHVEVHGGQDFTVYKYSPQLLNFIKSGEAASMIELHRELTEKEREERENNESNS